MTSRDPKEQPFQARRALLPCNDIYGGAKLYSGSPPTTQLAGCYYMPFKSGEAWGIFDRTGCLVRETGDLHGPNEVLHNQLDRIDANALSDAKTAPHDIYIYGGSIHFHFGHFIVNTLCRFWPMKRAGGRKPKILMHGPSKPTDWFKMDFIREAFDALDISADDLVCFNEPVHLPQLIVPWPAFQEQRFAYQAFSELCRHIGNRLKGSEPLVTNYRPAYLTKVDMPAAIFRMANEMAIVDFVRAAGFDVIYPERMSLSAKIRMFMERDWISGPSSSAMHVSLFSPPRAKIRAFNPMAGTNGNFPLLDLLNNNDAEYFYAPGTIIEPSRTPGYDSDVWLSDPTAIAADLVDMIDWRPSRPTQTSRWRPRWMERLR